ncbi:DUF4913 domain-containing protein [Streptomyces sp. NBC_00385]|uniref:DUF4913 domain-containing protein n=1 Tax=Streptomyces sp. NBC_00385 TaxID=2975733 RepID=UPI002DD80DAA|nr:DUF4913 domain-containing protein [Streptomyces sp. NBC_00385]WRZ03622.1 DUF4913 domain-containing protein [Streptomyces sp. NBC_00385]
MSDTSTTTPEPEPFRVPDGDLDDLASTLAKTMSEVRQHGVILDRLGSEPTPASAEPRPGNDKPAAETADPAWSDVPTSVFILALDDEAYTVELAALTTWVNHLFLPVYGREVSSSRPWCAQWHEHPEAVARLHALWLAWQQFTDAEAGLSGPSTWHRDHLDHTLVHLRAPDGPFGACTTSPVRPNHRVLATPAPVQMGLAA